MHAGQLECRRMVGMIARKPLNGQVEIEQERALAVVTNYALNPEKRRHTRAARHRPDVMEAAGGIKNHVEPRSSRLSLSRRRRVVSTAFVKCEPRAPPEIIAALAIDRVAFHCRERRAPDRTAFVRTAQDE